MEKFTFCGKLIKKKKKKSTMCCPLKKNVKKFESVGKMLFCGELNTSGTGIRIHTEFMFNLKLNQSVQKPN